MAPKSKRLKKPPAPPLADPIPPTQQPHIPSMSTHPHVPPPMAPTPCPNIPPPMAPTPQPYIPPLVDTTPQPHARRESSRVWTVHVIDEQGNTKKVQLTKPSVFEMPRGERIVVPFDRQLRAYGDAASLLSSACGRIATDSKNIPINFDSWPKVPKSYKDNCFNILKAVWALGNVAGDSPRYRDLVLGHGALIPLLAQLNEHAKLSMLRNATWTLSNFCMGKPQPPFEQIVLLKIY